MDHNRGRVEFDSSYPEHAAVCQRCGIAYAHHELRWQHEWVGKELVNQRKLVCPRCYDQPAEFLRVVTLPPEPRATLNAREDWAMDSYSNWTLLPGAVGQPFFPAVGGMGVLAVEQWKQFIPAMTATGSMYSPATFGAVVSVALSASASMSSSLVKSATYSVQFVAVGAMAGPIFYTAQISPAMSATGGASATPYQTRPGEFILGGAALGSIGLGDSETQVI
jgi:hypothetical protein